MKSAFRMAAAAARPARAAAAFSTAARGPAARASLFSRLAGVGAAGALGAARATRGKAAGAFGAAAAVALAGGALVFAAGEAHPADAAASDMALFSGNANLELAAEISSLLGVELGNITVSRFADGEVNVQVCRRGEKGQQ